MKLYHSPLSSSARRVSVTAHHLGIRLQERLINLGSPRDRQMLGTINPNGKIPVLEDGDLVLWESHAIMQYLCDLTPGQSLYPTPLRARTEVNRWLFWISSHLAPVVAPINFERLWKKMISGGAPDAALIERYEGFFHHAARVLEGHLADRPWLCGDQLSLADISAGSTLMYMEATRLPVDRYPRLRALVSRVRALESWKASEPDTTLLSLVA
jgi:glutathione S-transferase